MLKEESISKVEWIPLLLGPGTLEGAENNEENENKTKDWHFKMNNTCIIYIYYFIIDIINLKR